MRHTSIVWTTFDVGLPARHRPLSGENLALATRAISNDPDLLATCAHFGVDSARIDFARVLSGQPQRWTQVEKGEAWRTAMIALAAGAGAAAVMFAASSLLFRKFGGHTGACVRCGYDRAGLAVESPCPECGAGCHDCRIGQS